MEPTEYSPENYEATPSTSWRGKVPGGRLPFHLLFFLLSAAAMFLLYLVWYDYYMKGSYYIWYGMIVS